MLGTRRRLSGTHHRRYLVVTTAEDVLGRSHPAPALSGPRLVLDTNIVLDWLHFGDPSCAPLGRAIECGQVRWIATGAMRREMESVLVRGIPGRWPMDPAGVLRTWDRWAIDAERLDLTTGQAMPGRLPAQALRCQDPDDQKFIDLALAANASALLSRDRAVLRLGRRAAAHGLQILTAVEWRLDAST
jgi:hypothetical protein